MMEIDWEEPPEHASIIGRGHKPGRYREFAVALKKHPERWAVLPSDTERTEKGANATAQNIRRAKVKGFEPAGAFETAVSGTKIWVRYLGGALVELPGDEPQGVDDGPDEDRVPASTVRAWAQKEGIDVPDRGRLPQNVFDQYAEALGRGEVGLGLRSVKGE